MSESTQETSRGWIGWVQIGGILAVIVVAIVITMVLSGGGDEQGAEPPADARVPVEVVHPDVAPHRITVAATGTVEAKALVSITPQVGGQVREVSDSVREGGRFEAGEVLFRIDPRDYEVAVQRARANLADARSALAEIEAEADIAQEEWRATFPGRDITALAAREPQLEAARSRVMSAEADLNQARIDLDRTTLSFAFDGRVVASQIETGQVVSPGQAYGQVYSIGELEVVVPVPPEDAARLGEAEGRPVQIRLEGHDRPIAGEVLREGAQLDARSRLINLFVAPEQPDALRPGLFADVVIDGPELSRVLALPGTALSGLDQVHVVRGDEIESLRVEVLDRRDRTVFVEPFDYGEGVIVTPLPEGAIGRQARILTDTDEPAAARESGDE